VSNYRVRQVMSICKRLPQRQKDLLIGLATWLDDSTITVRLGNDQLAEASALHPDTVKVVKRELRKANVIDYEPGRHRGDRTLYRVLILAEGGANSTPPSEGGASSTPPSGGKGGSGGPERGDQEAPEGGIGKSADQQEPERRLKTQAKDSLSLADLLRDAVPAATEREIGYALNRLQNQNGNGQIKNMRAYLRKIIEQGDAAGMIADAGAELAERDQRQARLAGKQDEEEHQADGEVTVPPVPRDYQRIATTISEARADLAARREAADLAARRAAAEHPEPRAAAS
jgi:hypothetical protein